MAGYFMHMIHGYETYMHLSDKTKAQMPQDALRKFIIGSFVPDLVPKEKKQMTHFYKETKTKGACYYVPDMHMAEFLFKKKEPTYLGVLAHLRCDYDWVKNVLAIHAKPCENGLFMNQETGRMMNCQELFGDGRGIIGQLYKLYDKYNSEFAIRYMGKFNRAFGVNFSEDRQGFLGLIRWLFPVGIPMSGIPEMDDNRKQYDIHEIFKTAFKPNVDDCTLNIKIGDIIRTIQKSAFELAKKINSFYCQEETDCWEEVVKQLTERKLTIATMESCTGGLIASEITNISGASEVLKESYVTYCNDSKIKHGVSEKVIKRHSVYSQETAVEMANAARKLSCSNIAVGVTGQLGRIDPNNPVDCLNVVWYAIISESGKVYKNQIMVPDVERKKQKEYIAIRISKTIKKVIE